MLEDDMKFEKMVTAQPMNAELVMWLRAKSDSKPVKFIKPRWWPRIVPLVARHPYVLHTHPDLGSLLMDIAEELPGHYSQFLFGYDVVANKLGAVCASAVNMHDLIFRLPDNARGQALELGGHPHSDLGGEWVVFHAWSTNVTAAGEPEKVRESPPGSFGGARRDMNDRKRIAFFRVWCEEAWAYVNELSTDK